MSAAQHPVRVELEPRQSRLRQVLWVWLLTGGMLILLGPMRGQSLWSIADEQLGNGNRYIEILNLNPELRGDPGRLFPGQELTMPDPGR